MEANIILHTTPKSELKDLIAEAIKEQLSSFFEKKEPSTKLLSRKQTAEMLGISLPTLHSWTKDGIVAAVRLGSSVKYKVCDVEAAMDSIKSIKYSRK